MELSNNTVDQREHAFSVPSQGPETFRASSWVRQATMSSTSLFRRSTNLSLSQQSVGVLPTAVAAPRPHQAHERGGSGESGESSVNLAHMYGNRALVHVCLGDDASALDDLDRAVARDTRNIT